MSFAPSLQLFKSNGQEAHEHAARTSKSRSIVALVAAGLIGLGPSLAAGEQSQNEVPTLTHEEALQVDARSYAADFQVTFDEALHRLRAQHAFLDVVAAAEETLGPRFAGAWIDHVPDFRLVIKVTGGSSGLPDLGGVLASAPAETQVVAGAASSLEGLREAVLRTDAYLSAERPDLSLGLDVKTGTLRITSRSPIPSADAVAIQRVAAVPIEYVVDAMATFSPLHTYGARRVTATTGLTPCTTGFTVENTGTGVKGVTGAGHCGNTGLVYYDNGSNTYGLTLYGERFDDDQDAQWMVNTSHVVYAKFFDGFSYRSVTSVAPNLNAWIGDYVCHYGIATGYSCGIVDDVHFDPGNICGPSGTNDCFPSWVKVVEPAGGNLVCNAGDSGGPWFNGGVAYGILQSGQSPPSCPVATFMQHNYFGLMSLAVLTE